LVTIVVGTVGSLLLGAGPAAAANPPPTAAPKGIVVVDPTNPNQAYVQATYTCYGGTANGENHLWVSVKQGSGDLSQEGSSSIATAWYDAHPSNRTCNGKSQTTVFTIFREPGWAQLVPGSGYMQFCLIPTTGPPAIVNLTVAVVRPGYHPS
jgi:hypothetical protein